MKEKEEVEQGKDDNKDQSGDDPFEGKESVEIREGFEEFAELFVHGSKFVDGEEQKNPA